MSLDDRIKKELEAETEDIDDVLNDTEGMFSLASRTLKGGMGKWVIFVGIITFIVTGFMIWACYEFFVAGTVDERVFWGIWFVVTLNAQVALKQWTWMEANRTSLLREIKRAELAVAKLADKV